MGWCSGGVTEAAIALLDKAGRAAANEGAHGVDTAELAVVLAGRAFVQICNAHSPGDGSDQGQRGCRQEVAAGDQGGSREGGMKFGCHLHSSFHLPAGGSRGGSCTRSCPPCFCTKRSTGPGPDCTRPHLERGTVGEGRNAVTWILPAKDAQERQQGAGWGSGAAGTQPWASCYRRRMQGNVPRVLGKLEPGGPGHHSPWQLVAAASGAYPAWQ